MRLAGKETTTALKEERAQRLAKKMKAILATESGEPDVAVMALGKLLSTPAVRELALTETWAATVSVSDVVGTATIRGDQAVVNTMIGNAREFFGGLKSEKGGGGGSTNDTVITAGLAALVGDKESMAGHQASYVRLLDVRTERVKAAVEARRGAMEGDDKQYVHPSKAIYKNK